MAIPFKRSSENAFLIATIFTSRLSVPKISTVPSIARSENVPEGSSGNLLSTTSSSTSPAVTAFAKNRPPKTESTTSTILFITQRHHWIDLHGAAGGQITCDQGGATEDKQNERVNRKIMCAHPVKQCSHQSRRNQGPDQPDA